MKPIQGVIRKCDYCKKRRSFFSKKVRWVCTHHENLDSRRYDEPCTYQDWLKCPLNPNKKEAGR